MGFWASYQIERAFSATHLALEDNSGKGVKAACSIAVL
jgi:hypothetical protein